MAQTRVLDAIVTLLADDTQLRKSFAGLERDATRAGDRIGTNLSEGMARAVTPDRATQARPLQLPRVGGREVDITSPFQKGFQQFKTARELAELQRAGTGSLGLGLGNVSGQDRDLRRLAGGMGQTTTAAQRLASSLRLVSPRLSSVSTGALSALRGFAALGPAGLAAGAAIGTAAAAFLPYITRANAAIESTVKLAQAQSRADFAAFRKIMEDNADATIRYGEQAKFALDSTAGLQGMFQRMIASAAILKNIVAEFFGGGLEASTEEAKRAAIAATSLFQVLERPKLDAQALKDAAGLLERQASLSAAAAVSAEDLARSTDDLVRAKRDQAAANKALIETEITRLNLERIRTPERGVEIDAQVADARRRQANIDRALILDEQDLRRQGERDASEFASREGERQEREADRATNAIKLRSQVLTAFADSELERIRIAKDSAVALQKVEADRFLDKRRTLELELEAVRSNAELSADFRRKRETDISREIEQLDHDHLQKRAEAAAQAVELAQRDRQARIAGAEELFSIQRTLNQRRLRDDLATQADIARAATSGSEVQIAALKRVAEAQAQIQERARSVLGQALSVADQQRQRLGLEGATFVSQASLKEDLERQRRRDAEVRRQFEAGQAVRADELRGAVGNLPFEQQFADFGSRIGDVFSAATKPLEEAFRNTVGVVVDGELRSLADRATEGFTGLVTGAGTQLGHLESLFSGTIDRMVQKADDGFSRMADSIHRSVEDRLARSLRDLERRS